MLEQFLVWLVFIPKLDVCGPLEKIRQKAAMQQKGQFGTI